MSAREEAKQIEWLMELFSGGYIIRSRIAIPDFRKAVEQEGERKQLSSVLLHQIHFNFEVLIYPSGYTPENNGYVSVLFDLVLVDGLQIDSVTVKHFEFTCIASLVDNSGAERFTQSVVKVRENNEGPPFGFERFAECRTLLNNYDEFISNDELTISCYCICKDNGLVTQIIKVTGFPENVNESCPSAIKCRAFRIKECCQSVLAELGTEETVFKLLFRGPLFEFLKKESKFFQRIQQAQMRERCDNFMKIPSEEKEVFDWIQNAVFFNGTFRVLGSPMGMFCRLYEFAEKYEISCILEACSDYLRKKLVAKNTVEVLILADLHNDLDLKAAAINCIKSCWQEVKSTEDWNVLKETRRDLVDEILLDNFQLFS